MKTLLSRRMRLLLVLAAAFAMVAQIVIPGLQAQAAPKVLRYGLTGEPDTIDPQQANYTDQVAWSYALWRSPLKYNEKMEPVPSIAKEVPSVANGGISKDGLTYTFHLQTNWKWSDGKGVVTAGDFVYSLQRLVDPKQASAYGNFLNGVVVNAQEIQDGKKDPSELGVKAVDDATLQVTLVKPAAYFNDLAATWTFAAVRKDNVERAGLSTPAAWTDPANGEVVGSGPFIIKSWEHGSKMVFVKNPNFAGTPAKVDEIDVTLQDDAAVQYASYRAGALDVAEIPTAELDTIRTDATLKSQLDIYPNLCTWYFRMDNTTAPFSNPQVRQAISYAIDRETYVKVIQKGLWTPTYSFIPPTMFGYDKTIGTNYAYNPDKAKKMLADAGYPNGQGFPTIPYTYRAGANGQRSAEWLQAQLQQLLNINLELQPMENAAYQRMTSDPVQKPAGMGLSGWCADYPHPADWFGLVFKYGANGNSSDIPGFKNADFDKLSDAADSELDQVKAEKAYKDLGKLLVDQAAVIFVGNPLFPYIKSSKVKLTVAASDGGMPGSINWEGVDISG